MKNTDSKIPNIIAAYSLKELSAEEFEVLKNWLAEDPENEEMFIGYLKLYKKSRQIGFFQSLDKSIAWNKIVSRVNCTTSEIDQQPVKIIPLRKIPYKFIAAASIAAILFLGIYFSEKNILPLESNNSSKENPVGVIPPGNSKAILTLEDGSEVELKKGSQYSNQNTKVNGTEIVYDENASKTDTKISYNFLTIPRGGTYCVELSDNTKVWLNSESKLKFPVNFKEGYMREVVLEYGEAYFEVSSSTKHKGAGFTVLTKEQEIEVLGTQFNVKAYKDENIISTTLLEVAVLRKAVSV